MELTKEMGDTSTANGGEDEPKAKKRRNPFNTQQRKDEKERRQKKKARLVVRNISYKATEELLRKHFSQWGNVEEVNLLKRPDGKLVGCAFVQYNTITQASKAVQKGKNKTLLGRCMYIDWAVGKDEYASKSKDDAEPAEKKFKIEAKQEKESVNENATSEQNCNKSVKEESEEESDSDTDKSEQTDDGESDTDASEKKKIDKSKLNISKVKKEKQISNDVQQGCTVFIKNVPFDAEDADLRKVCRKFGPLYYTIINREPTSGHSKGTAFVKFKTKESADLCLQSGTEFTLMDQPLDPFPALSKEEIRNQEVAKSKGEENKDSRNLYLAREGLIMANSNAAEGVSASDMTKRHKLEQIKTQVLRNLNRFVSRNRLSIHNLPINYDNEKLKNLVIQHTSHKPHECRVMRENKITPEHPKGKSKGFGFMSFNTHQEALNALRKLNNNPKVFGNQHRPIVAFSIEDRAVHKIKEKRKEKSKVSNPTYQEKLEKRKLKKGQKTGKLLKPLKGPQSDDKNKLKKHIEKLETSRAAKLKEKSSEKSQKESANYVGTEAKPGASIRMRSNKKIAEQAQEHQKRVKANKRKEKAQKIRQIHLAERKAVDRTKQGRNKEEYDELAHLVNRYKHMIDNKANEYSNSTATPGGSNAPQIIQRKKWYQD